MPVVVAGHICLDIIPAFRRNTSAPDALFAPGALVEIGQAVLSTGGAVSNTGLALHRLGTPVRLMGKIGDDLFGEAVRRISRPPGSRPLPRFARRSALPNLLYLGDQPARLRPVFPSLPRRQRYLLLR